jgi:hypothetical protein
VRAGYHRSRKRSGSPRFPPLSLLRILALLCVIPALAVAQAAATGVVAGRAILRADSAAVAPAARAGVSIVGTALGTNADADGRFLIERVPAGAATVRVRLLGYRTADRAIHVPAGDTVRIDMVLQPDVRLLAPIRADARAEDVVNFETRPSVATIAITAAAMAGIPKIGEPDVARVVQLLPGVIARNDYNSGLNVRGGEADQNLVLLDGHPIYNPFHLGGLFSTFMDATVGGIELLTGAFPARYGGRLSSVLDVRSADETRAGINTTADISALGASAKFGGVFGNGRGMWSLAGRRTYADAVQRIFTDNLFPYHFRDLHGRLAYALPRNVRVAVTAYSGKDVLDANFAQYDTDTAPSRASQGGWEFNWGNRVIGATVAKQFSGATLEQRVTVTSFSTLLNLGEGAFSQRNEVRDVRVGGSLQGRFASHDPSIGYDLAAHRVRYASGSPATGSTEFDLLQRPEYASAWIGDLWRVSPRWIIEGGLRGEALTGRGWAALSPRLSGKFFVTRDLALTAGAGRVTQVMHSLAGDGPLRYFDIWLASDSFIPVTTAWHWVGGLQRRIGDVGSVRLEGFRKRYDRLLEANASEDPQRRGDEFFAARGESYGLDLLARWHPGARVSGWVAYTYGVSARWRDEDGARWWPGHDRRHDLDVVATWHLSKYRLGARFGYASGTPYTPIVGQLVRRVYDPSLDRWGTGDPRLFLDPMGGPRNSARFPASHRLDLDASRDFRIRGATYSPYLSIVNAYNAQNVFVYLYNYSTDAPSRRAISQFPVLPSLGVRIVF